MIRRKKRTKFLYPKKKKERKEQTNKKTNWSCDSRRRYLSIVATRSTTTATKTRAAAQESSPADSGPLAAVATMATQLRAASSCRSECALTGSSCGRRRRFGGRRVRAIATSRRPVSCLRWRTRTRRSCSRRPSWWRLVSWRR